MDFMFACCISMATFATIFVFITSRQNFNVFLYYFFSIFNFLILQQNKFIKKIYCNSRKFLMIKVQYKNKKNSAN